MLLRILILSLCFTLGVRSQENAGSSVAKSLMECYNKTENLDRENRFASSINILIALIRKIESGPSLQNSRELSKEIIHRFKQDGIVTYSKPANNPYTIPYTPKGMQSDKHRILLQKLVPGNAVNFPNETLSELERCSLHFMLSNSLDVRQRGDEDTVCNKLDRYQRRIRRHVDPNDDVEIFHPSKSSPSKGNLQESELEEGEPEPAVEQVETNVFQAPNERKTITFLLSDCPLENGAVYTRWGTIQAGTVIAAIATGEEPQNIQTDSDYFADNRYAATLTGDLSEVALHQGTAGKGPLTVGANGGWNGTQVPRWYFIQKNSNSEMTDAEIRGGLDGLIIALNIKDWYSQASSLKISQMLDMYYSPRGVFSKKFRACNRKNLFTEVAPQKELTDQTIAFSFLLDDEAKLHGSISREGIKAYSEEAVNALINYIPSLPDLSCDVEDDKIVRASTDILIVLDCQWRFDIIQRALAYLLDNLDINKYDSNFTIINGKDGDVIVNSSNSVLDFYTQYDKKIHIAAQSGFDVSRVFNTIEMITKRKIDDNTRIQKAGGQSTVVLFIPYGTLSGSDQSIANDKKQYFKNSLPDLKLLVLGRNSKEAYTALVLDPISDAFSLPETTDGTSITGSVNPVIARVKQIHRRIVNPNCGSSWSGSSGSASFDQYVEPNSTNYYRIAPHYFFGEGTRKVKIQSSGYGTLIACFSRQDERPGQNSTSDCQRTTSTEISFSLTDGCKDYDEVSKCPPAYFSVGTEHSTSIRCNDAGCRFPDNVKYTIQIENFGCASGTYRVMANIAALMMTFLTIKLVF